MLSEIFLLPFVYINPFTFAFVIVLHQEDLFFYKLTPNANKMCEIRLFLAVTEVVYCNFIHRRRINIALITKIFI